MKFYLLLGFILCSLIGVSQNTSKTILWEVSKKGNKHKSYLFGTFHEVSPDFFTSLTASVEKLKNSDIVFIEETQNNMPDSSNDIKQLLVWNKSEWDKLFTNEQRHIFQAFVTKSELNDFYKLPPLVLARTLGGIYFSEFCEYDTNRTESMDFYIENLALQHKKPVKSLDNNQIKMLKTVSLSLDSIQNALYTEASIAFMDKMLKDDLSICDYMNKYKSFDIDYELNTDLTQMKNYSPLLIDRNISWIAILERSLESQNCFVAVGLKHLFYKQGIIQQLRHLGYTVNPILAR